VIAFAVENDVIQRFDAEGFADGIEMKKSLV